MSPVGGAGFVARAVSAPDETAELALAAIAQVRRHKEATTGTNGLRNTDFIAGHPQQPWRHMSPYGKHAINE
jgi:hypothetical protein